MLGESAGGGQPGVNELYSPGTNIVDRATLVAGGWTILKEPLVPVASHMLLLARKKKNIAEQVCLNHISTYLVRSIVFCCVKKGYNFDNYSCVYFFLR